MRTVKQPTFDFWAVVYLGVMLGTWALCLLVLVLTTAADAHDWFTGAKDPVTGHRCCDGTDCSEIPDTDVEKVTGGYIYLPTGEFIPRARIQPSQGYGYARCVYQSTGQFNGKTMPPGSTRCFFEPSGF